MFDPIVFAEVGRFILPFLSVLTVVFGGFVLRAFVPSIFRGGRQNPVSWMAAAFVVIGAAWVCRSVYWDIIWPLSSGNQLSNPHINITFDLIVLVSQYCALKARLLTIPEDVRGQYNIFTAVRYPKGMNLFWWRAKGKDDE